MLSFPGMLSKSPHIYKMKGNTPKGRHLFGKNDKSKKLEQTKQFSKLMKFSFVKSNLFNFYLYLN